MFVQNRRRAAVTAVGAAVVSLGIAFANHSWGGYHWARQSNPFTLRLGDNVSSAWDSYLQTASSDWSRSRVLDAVVVSGQANSKNCRPGSGRIEICNAAYGNNGWLGIAQVWVSGTHITQGSVKMNDSYFNTATYNKPAWRQMVMCQEIGHVFGLDHQDENFSNANLGTCMDYTNDPGTNQAPNAHDYAMLEGIYAHADSSSTVPSSVPPAMSQLDLDGPGQWGKLVKSSKGGKKETYELDFGGGHKVFTFVTWVDGNERGRGRE